MQQFFKCALAGVFALGAVFAQTTTTTTSQTITTGIVGLSVNQSARINILNLNPNTGTPVVCSADVQFVNAVGDTLKRASIANIDPGKEAEVTLDRLDVPDQAMPRINLRGVVTTPSAAATPAPAACSVLVTLEIIDDSTARTDVVVTGSAVPSH
jgi:hypothetical protein